LQARAADEARYSEVAEDFKAALPDAVFDYILIYLPVLLDVYRFI
jgi:hypothetical protein